MHYCSLASVVALVVAAVGARRVELELNESLETDVGQEEHGKERLRGRTSDYCSDTIPYGQKLDCGEDVDLCGVLALKTGMGEDEYSHPKPMVHGLWPTVGEHGNSKCVKPSRSSEDPAALHLCYTRKGMEKQNFFFQRHEWRKHGVCAGVKDAAHYFKQVCQLAEKPLKAIEEIMKVHKDLDDIIFELQDQGICVAYQGYSSQEIMLSACRNKNGKWKLADSQDFSEVCGKKSKPNKPKKPLPVEWDFIGDEEDEGEEKGKEEDANPAPHTFDLDLDDYPALGG